MRTFIIVLTLLGCLLPDFLVAQALSPRQGELFRAENKGESFGLFGRGGSSMYDGFGLQNFGEEGNDLTLQTFGEEVPLGSCMLILVASGMGYMALKKKQTSKTNGKENIQ